MRARAFAIVFAAGSLIMAAPLARADKNKPHRKASSKKAELPRKAVVKEDPVPTRPAALSSERAQAGSEGSPGSRGSSRIDFDERLVEGQTNKAGAVYLYDRKETSLSTMVKRRDSFRAEIARDTFE